MRKNVNKGQVIIPTNHPTPPESHELNAALLLARYYQCTVEFLVPTDTYRRKTPDFKMLDVEWELKSPISSTKNTIANQIRLAYKQSKYIVIDLRRSKLNDTKAYNSAKNEFEKRRTIKRIILANFQGKFHFL